MKSLTYLNQFTVSGSVIPREQVLNGETMPEATTLLAVNGGLYVDRYGQQRVVRTILGVPAEQLSLRGTDQQRALIHGSFSAPRHFVERGITPQGIHAMTILLGLSNLDPLFQAVMKEMGAYFRLRRPLGWVNANKVHKNYAGMPVNQIVLHGQVGAAARFRYCHESQIPRIFFPLIHEKTTQGYEPNTIEVVGFGQEIAKLYHQLRPGAWVQIHGKVSSKLYRKTYMLSELQRKNIADLLQVPVTSPLIQQLIDCSGIEKKTERWLLNYVLADRIQVTRAANPYSRAVGE